MIADKRAKATIKILHEGQNGGMGARLKNGEGVYERPWCAGGC